MTWWGRVAIWLAVSACGRFGFEARTGGPGGGDAAGAGDDAVHDAATIASMAPEGPSCGGLPATCGVNGTESCCASPLVTGGTYDRGYDSAGGGAMNYPATVSSFWLDTYEISVGRFRQFVNAGFGTQASPPPAGAGAHPKIPNSGWDPSWNASLPADTASLIATVKCTAVYQTWTDTPGANEDRPMNCISWFDAMAFCAWDGRRLPTEAEWNYAAAGGDQQRAYPWSSPASSLTIDPSYASYWLDGTSTCLGDGMPGCAMTDLVVVGTKSPGNGRWGQADLAGNMLEWTLDTLSAYPSPCDDCASLSLSGSRAMRGGSMFDPSSYLRSSFRSQTPPSTRSANSGARCARSP